MAIGVQDYSGPGEEYRFRERSEMDWGYYCLYYSRTRTKTNLVYLFSLICFCVVYFWTTAKVEWSIHVIQFIPCDENLTEYKVNVDLILHAVYFDRRPQKSHSNATVISMSILEGYRERILGCEVDGVLQLQFEVIDIAVLRWIKKKFQYLTHKDCFLYCYDMSIQEDSVISVLYNKSGTVVKEPVRSDLVIPNYDAEEEAVMVCATGFGEVQHLDEWLTYQRTIGVKFIHLNVNPSFLINVNKSSLLQNLTDTGYIKIVVWEDYLNESQVYYYSQSLKYQDCVLRYQGKYKYMMVIDFDEYFIPLGKSKDVLSCAKSLITWKYGSVEMYRSHYYCIAKDVNMANVPSDGNLTKLYDTSISVRNREGKSIHLVKAVRLNSVHDAGLILPPYRYRNNKKHLDSSCYIAHLKPERPKGGGKTCRE